MANYTALVQALVASINKRVTVKDTIDSIDPIDAGGSMTDIPNTLLTALNTINEFNILGGTSAPDNSIGIEDDVYIQHGTTFAFWKKDNNSWVQKVVIDLGINIVDGNINLQSSISGQVVTVSAGQWGINNVIYTKATQDQFTLTGADLNFDRIDAVFANMSSAVHYVAGTPSSNPDGTKPVTPTNEVIVCYIYVPSVASGNPPYISDSQTSVTPPSSPIVDKFITIEVDSSLAGSYELDLSSETDLPMPSTKPLVTINSDEAQSAYLWQQSTKNIIGLPELVEGDIITVYMIGRQAVEPPITPNTGIQGVNFGSAAAIQSFLISKGNTGAIVDGYQLIGSTEAFRLSGITSLASNTFLGSTITSFINESLTGSIGSSCFASSSIITFSAPVSSLGLYAFTNCAALTTIDISTVTTIDPGAFQNATGLNGQFITLSGLSAPNGLGGSPGNELVFDGITGLKPTVPTAFATNNSGAPDGDLAAVTAAGGTVNYI